jgi:hypothetical protein
MKTRFSVLLALALFAVVANARADRNPDFDDDAKPILQMQPGLLDYVEHTFDVKGTGIAKFPGNDDQRPRPPFIFNARPKGRPGPFHLRLLIQPGPVDHILKVVDLNQTRIAPPGMPGGGPAPQPVAPPPQNTASTPPPAPAPSPAAATPDANTPSGPITSDTPSGPIKSANSLAPPPDPAPAQ